MGALFVPWWSSPGEMSWIGVNVIVTLHALGAVEPGSVAHVILSYQSKFNESSVPARPLPPTDLNDLAMAFPLSSVVFKKSLIEPMSPCVIVDLSFTIFFNIVLDSFML